MSAEFSLTKERLDEYLALLAKQFSKLYKKKAEAEIILIGGASVLANYDFRDASTDADALIYADASMKEAINFVRDKFGLPDDWLNEDFKKTKSYTEKLRGVSVPYRTFSSVVHVRTVADKYLVAMKAMSGRQYKFDLSDIVGILWEHEKNGKPIDRGDVDKAFIELYGQQKMPDVSRQVLDVVFRSKDYERIYIETREKEKEAKEILVSFEQESPNVLNGDKLDSVIEQVRLRKMQNDSKIGDS